MGGRLTACPSAGMVDVVRDGRPSGGEEREARPSGGEREIWQTLAVSVTGAGHRARGIGCEDACAVEVMAGADGGEVLVLAVADGAGSASRAAEGSNGAVAAVLDVLRADPSADLCAALRAAREALDPSEEEAADGVVLGDRATTLLVARVADGTLSTAQIGDGAVVVRRSGRLEVLCADERGEYLNETSFLTSSGWEERVRVGETPAAGIDAVAGMTDGLQLVAFDLTTGTPHAPFFSPFFSFAAADGSAEELAAFLGSERVAGRTDDDVTLALAVRTAG
jgi:hypothetical protein